MFVYHNGIRVYADTETFVKFCKRCNRETLFYKKIRRCIVCTQKWHKNTFDKRHEYYLERRRIWGKSNRKITNKLSRKWRFENKLDVIKHYTNGTMRCVGFPEGECILENKPIDYKLLQIDHIDGNGKRQRDSIKGMDLCRWIIKNNYPSNFQILCPICNMKKEFARRGI